jgi:ectoine hydroxylase-related dioxygenase (phytanoyl-CoA dioxygenase family)
MPRTLIEETRATYERDGFCTVPKLVDNDILDRAQTAMDQVIAGDYETGEAPVGVNWRPGDDPHKIIQIFQPHQADRTLQELVRQPEIGRWAAALTGASMVQVWAVQLLCKPPAPRGASAIGWHQDEDSWQHMWTPGSEIFTCWLALSDVGPESGPVLFVPGSQRWGFLNSGDFRSQDLEGLKAGFPIPEGEEWLEVPALIGRGAASFHHKLTVHGSAENLSDSPRSGFAIHLRSERSTPADTMLTPYRDRLDDPAICPVVYGRAQAGL